MLILDYQESTLPDPWEDIDFSKVQFKGIKRFSGYLFPSFVNFSNSYFNDFTNFHETKFYYSLDFRKAHFHFPVEFIRVNFYETACFVKVQFHASAYFSEARFYSDADFRNVDFHGSANFTKAHFHKWTSFAEVAFIDQPDFTNAVFEGTLDFSHTKCKKGAVFTEACFHVVPDFHGAQVAGVLKFIRTKWPDLKKTNQDHADIAIAYSQLRRQMEEMKLHEYELAFHVKELQTKIHDPKQSWKVRSMYTLYDLFAGCGRSIIRPVASLLATLGLFFFLYLFMLFLQIDVIRGFHFSDRLATAFYLALHNSLPLVSTDTNLQSKVIEWDSICYKSKWCYISFSLMRIGQVIASITFMFLLGLGLRNRFRMR